MELKYVEMLEKAIIKMKEENSPFLNYFTNIKDINFDEIKSGDKKLSDFISDEKLSQIATRLNISIQGKDREEILKTITVEIKKRIKSGNNLFSKLGELFKK